MIIDIHTHTFPDKIAVRVISQLAHGANTKNYVDGTISCLRESMKSAGIDYAVLQPVATRPEQQETINRTAIAINNEAKATGVMSFGGIHPDNDNYKEIIDNLVANGIKGIKLHPVFQTVFFDDIRYMRIVDYASSKGMIILVHGGIDISFPGDEYVTPEHILPVIRQVQPEKLILAHMGGWNAWNQVEELLVGEKVYFDTAFSIEPVLGQNGAERHDVPRLPIEQFVRIVKNHGANRILFGSDSPWSDQSASIEMIKTSGLTSDECKLILGDNAAGLLF